MNAIKSRSLEIPSRIRDIHQQALEVSARFRTAEVDLLDVLELVDRHRVYLRYGFSSLFQYAVQSLKLSESVAYNFINVARKAREVPELKKDIVAGVLTISKARKITSVLTAQNKTQWLELARASSQAKVEREVARANPHEAGKGMMTYVSAGQEVPEKARIQSQGGVRVQLQVGISERLMIKLRRAQDLESQRTRRVVTLEETLEAMANLYLTRNDPVAKAQRQLIRGKVGAEPASEGASNNQVGDLTDGRDDRGGDYRPKHETKDRNEPAGNQGELFLRTVDGSATAGGSIANNETHRAPLPAETKHRVMLKYAGRCGHVDGAGRRCNETRFLEIHHLQPVSTGGTNEVENLALLCSGHHRGVHLTMRYT